METLYGHATGNGGSDKGLPTVLSAPPLLGVRNRGLFAPGSGYAYRVLWVYRHKGMPFRENAAYDVWRQVTASDSAVGWMSMEMLSDNRTVLLTGKDRTQIHEDLALDAKVVGLADPSAVMKLKACLQEACRVLSGEVDGWIPKSWIWSVGAGEVFKVDAK